MKMRYSVMKVVNTNMGKIPVVDYLEIVACQNGFDSYEEMRAEGIIIDLPEGDIEDIEE